MRHVERAACGKPFRQFLLLQDGGPQDGQALYPGRALQRGLARAMRDLVLGGGAARFPEVVERRYLIIKEPNGSIGSPLLMEALPESSMIFLIRDPRDVVASSIDARSEGSWLQERREDHGRGSKPDRNPNAYAKMRANSYVRQIEKT